MKKKPKSSQLRKKKKIIVFCIKACYNKLNPKSQPTNLGGDIPIQYLSEAHIQKNKSKNLELFPKREFHTINQKDWYII